MALGIPRQIQVGGLIALVAAYLSACTAISGPAKLENANTTPTRSFTGLLPSATDPVSPRYVFQTNGMGTHQWGWEQQLFSPITLRGYDQVTVPDAQGRTIRPAQLARKMVVSGEGMSPMTFPAFGLYRKDVFTNRKTKDVVVVFTYFWGGDLPRRHRADRVQEKSRAQRDGRHDRTGTKRVSGSGARR